jgi:hypothetical protein
MLLIIYKKYSEYLISSSGATAAVRVVKKIQNVKKLKSIRKLKVGHNHKSCVNQVLRIRDTDH